MKRFLRVFFVFELLLAAKLGAQEWVCLGIRASDVEALGGWPLDRKWYALAIQNLSEAGAARIFIDIAFPAADFAHPESDEFFYATLAHNPHVYLLSGVLNATGTDSLHVLGTRTLPAGRFFLPFSAIFTIENSKILLKAEVQHSLLRYLLPADFALKNFVVSFPQSAPLLDSSFLAAVKDRLDCAGKDVFIFLDYPGITSYLVNENTRDLISTSELQLYVARQIRAGNYAVKWPDWQLAGLFFCALLPLIFYRKTSPQAVWAGASLALVFAVVLGLHHFGVHLARVWYGVALVPMGILCYEGVNRGLARKFEKWQHADRAAAHAHENILTAGTSVEIKQLREKLGFYEYLLNQTPPVALEYQGNADILYHPASPLVQILQKAESIAASDIAVMIFGESGTGKEQLAKYLHAKSPRAGGEFIAVNCASFNENLIESELFGYEAGAFTGALRRKMGRFELAHGGTLFLDEIGETAGSFQAKLLRVLQEGSFERVGGVEPVRISVRVIAATNQNLQEAIQAGRFREDLFYRLNGFSLHLPPLRERKDDIEYLFRAFLYDAGPEIQLSEAIISWLRLQRWPGNIRELKTATQRAVLNAQLKRRKFLLPEDFELQEAVATGSAEGKENLAQRILQALRDDGFRHRSIAGAAQRLGLHRATVTEYLRGWVMRYLHVYNFDLSQICRALAGEAALVDEEQFKARIEQYAASVQSRIAEGLRQNETDNTLRHARFKSLPQEFEPDLQVLITKIKNAAR